METVRPLVVPPLKAETSCLGGYPGGSFNGAPTFVSNGCAVDDQYDCDCTDYNDPVYLIKNMGTYYNPASGVRRLRLRRLPFPF